MFVHGMQLEQNIPDAHNKLHSGFRKHNIFMKSTGAQISKIEKKTPCISHSCNTHNFGAMCIAGTCVNVLPHFGRNFSIINLRGDQELA